MRNERLTCLLLLGFLYGTTTQTLADSVETDVKSEVVAGDDGVITPKFGEDAVDSQNEGTKNKGALKIDRAPNIKFGVVPVKKRVQEVKAINGNPYVQISDVRGVLTGWTLSATLSSFTSGVGADQLTIDGAYLTFSDNQVTNFDSEDAIAPKVAKEIKLNYANQTVAMASKDSGQGIWGIKWETIKLKLYPNTAKPDHSYTAKINWTLTDGPKE